MNTAAHNESADTGQTFIYFGWLTLFVYLATPGGYWLTSRRRTC